MSRFPAIPTEQRTEAHGAIDNGVAEVFSRVPSHIEWKGSTGEILGPYSPLFYTPELAEPWFNLALSVTRQQRLTWREKELAILAVLAEYRVPYVLYAHSQVAAAAGLSPEQIQQAVDGETPAGLSQLEADVYRLALQLAKLRGPMPSDDFETAKSTVGRDRIVGLVHIVSGFIYVAMLCNISDGEVPDTSEGVFVASPR